MNFQPSVAITWSIGVARSCGSVVGQVPTAALPVAFAPSRQAPSSPPSVPSSA